MTRSEQRDYIQKVADEFPKTYEELRISASRGSSFKPENTLRNARGNLEGALGP